jgi:hypothetical protein
MTKKVNMNSSQTDRTLANNLNSRNGSAMLDESDTLRTPGNEINSPAGLNSNLKVGRDNTLLPNTAMGKNSRQKANGRRQSMMPT